MSLVHRRLMSIQDRINRPPYSSNGLEKTMHSFYDKREPVEFPANLSTLFGSTRTHRPRAIGLLESPVCESLEVRSRGGHVSAVHLFPSRAPRPPSFLCPFKCSFSLQTTADSIASGSAGYPLSGRSAIRIQSMTFHNCRLLNNALCKSSQNGFCPAYLGEGAACCAAARFVCPAQTLETSRAPCPSQHQGPRRILGSLK